MRTSRLAQCAVLATFSLAVSVARAKELFFVFSDATSGKGSYPGGRFLYTALPDKDGNVTLDFNRAYSPPCAFTDFATCPLPPPQNRLKVAIAAGERYEGRH